MEDLSRLVVENYGQMMTLMDEGNKVSLLALSHQLADYAGENSRIDQHERDVISLSCRVHRHCQLSVPARPQLTICS